MNINTEHGHLSAAVSIIAAIGAWFSPENIDISIKIILAISSLTTAVMAIRYYHFATKEKKENLKNIKAQ